MNKKLICRNYFILFVEEPMIVMLTRRDDVPFKNHYVIMIIIKNGTKLSATSFGHYKNYCIIVKIYMKQGSS